MNRYKAAVVFLAAITLISQTSCVLYTLTGNEPDLAPVEQRQGCATLDRLPFKEAWYGMYFQEDKVGYSHFKIQPDGKNFSIQSDSLMRLTALKKTNEIAMKERVQVKPDLTLISFKSRVRMNNKDLLMDGKLDGARFLLTVSVEGEKMTREYPVRGDLYHTSAVSLMPAIRGLKDGEKYSFGVFNPEKQGVEQIDQELRKVQGRPGPNGEAWKVRNNYGRSTVYSWLNRKGLAVLERALEGSLITMLEDEATAMSFLKKGKPTKDLVLDFSLIKIEKPIPNPTSLKYLKVEMQGVDDSLIPNDHRQRLTLDTKDKKETSSGPFDVEVRVEKPGAKNKTSRGEKPQLDPGFLESTPTIQSNHEEIVNQAKKIVNDDDSAKDKITKLVHWTADNIKNQMQDSFTALSVLRAKEGECQSHAKLYTALARAQGVPTRVVTGLVYTEDVGFLYHAWAESYADGWISVDPTLDQVPSDATHIKISTGESSNDLNTVLKMAGKVKIRVLDFDGAGKASSDPGPRSQGLSWIKSWFSLP